MPRAADFSYNDIHTAVGFVDLKERLATGVQGNDVFDAASVA